MRTPCVPTTPADTDHLVLSAGSLDVATLSGFFVYQAFDRDGALLYVGQSTCLLARLGHHQRQSAFWRAVTTVTYEQLPNARAMTDREAALIRQHRPPHNTIGVQSHTVATLPPGTAEPYERIIPRHPRNPAKGIAKDLGIVRSNLAQATAEPVETV